ncbi:hypothetical protein N7508_001298 [Penicillium antarcticum]|uniref:uncharacterized protein n=1 Tax=Penicillium antarcticum TaxID=416450 RepID=UPI002390BFAC|nr:uncharacterized protein N7508_001298 [Penicillium antarcticum]KAJ5316790.1 hypothetical protein N7508_001298 [Penicillium antarcticum]
MGMVPMLWKYHDFRFRTTLNRSNSIVTSVYTIHNLSVYGLSFADSSAEKLESLRDRRAQPAAAATNTPKRAPSSKTQPQTAKQDHIRTRPVCQSPQQGDTARMISLVIHTIQYSYQRNAAIPGELHVCASSTPNVITTWLIELCSPVVPWPETKDGTRKTRLARRHTPPPSPVCMTCCLSFYLFLYANGREANEDFGHKAP